MERQSNRRVRVASSDQAIGLNVAAPSNVQTISKAAQNAKALQDLIGVGTDIGVAVSDRRFEKAELLGTQIAIGGGELTADQKKRDGVVSGFNRIQNKSAVVELRKAALETYQRSANKDNPELINEELDAVFNKRFGALDPEADIDAQTFRQVAPEWLKIQAEIAQIAQADAQIAIQQDIEDDTSILARDQYARIGVVDWQQINDDAMEAGLTGPRTNDLIASLARDIAERTGDVSVIDSIPDKWRGGAASPKNTQKHRDGLRGSRTAAANHKIFLDNKAQKAADDAQDARNLQAESNITELVIAGQPARAPQAILSAMKKGMDPGDGRVLFNFAEAVQSQSLGVDDVDFDFVAANAIEISNGNFGLEELTAAVASGRYGSGDDLTDVIVSQTAQIRAAKAAVRTDPLYTSRRDELDALYSSQNELEELIPLIGIRKAEAMTLFMDKVFKEGIDAETAKKQVEQELPPRSVEFWNDVSQNGGAKFTPATVVARWRIPKNGVSPATVRAILVTGGSDLLTALEQGLITNAELIQLEAQ